MRYEDELPVYIKREYNIVYFLLKEMDVVYVGKSTVGLARAFSHNDMDYDCVSYIPCSSKEETDDCESYYIMKYRPKYNKSPGAYNYSLSLNCV